MSEPTSSLKQADILYQLTPTLLEIVANVRHEHTYATGEIILVESASNK